MKKRWLTVLAFWGGLSGRAAMAGPISYEGGWMFSTDNQADLLEWQLNYSIKSWLSFGADYAYSRMQAPQKTYALPRMNFLLKRWNEINSQGNIYLYGGAGAMEGAGQKSLAWLAGTEIDWESRKFYATLRAQYLDSREQKNDSMIQARLGIAPYLTKFDNLHSWVILQMQYFPSLASDSRFRLSPLMRFYVSNVLWEMGVSSRGEWLFNTMVHF